LKLFIEYINNDQESNQELKTKDLNEKEYLSEKKIIPKRNRDISERLRFSILLRDGFSCKACGKSPLRSPGTELHVDHIIPWSKGGETVPDNLETKCLQGNLGKGNAFTQ
jgi:5-methylcytosine-specific restriction endonuclease McrA